MRDAINIRPLALCDIDGIVALKSRVIKRPEFDPQTEKSIYEWALINNPNRTKDDFLGFVLESGENIVGSVVLVPSACATVSGARRLYFESDLMVAGDFRFHGLKLLDKVWNSGIFPVVIATTPNRLSYTIEISLGAKAIPFSAIKYIRFIGLVRPEGCKYNSVMGKVFGAVNSCYITAGKLVSKIRTPWLKKISVVKINNFGSEFDGFCRKISLDYDLLVSRDSRYLNWRYVEFPFGNRNIFKAVDHTGKLCGYMVLQDESACLGTKTVNILEIFTHINDRHTMRALIDAAVSYSVGYGADLLEHIPCTCRAGNVLAESGFWVQKLPVPACLYKMDAATGARYPHGPKRWFISSGDGDTAVYSAVPPRGSRAVL